MRSRHWDWEYFINYGMTSVPPCIEPPRKVLGDCVFVKLIIISNGWLNSSISICIHAIRWYIRARYVVACQLDVLNTFMPLSVSTTPPSQSLYPFVAACLCIKLPRRELTNSTVCRSNAHGFNWSASDLNTKIQVWEIGPLPEIQPWEEGVGF